MNVTPTATAPPPARSVGAAALTCARNLLQRARSRRSARLHAPKPAAVSSLRPGTQDAVFLVLFQYTIKHVFLCTLKHHYQYNALWYN